MVILTSYTGNGHMRFPRIFIYVLFPLLLVNAAIAGPPQRLIIQFDNSLSAEQQQALHHQIKSIFKTDYELLPHSTDQCWIVVVDPALNVLDLEKVIEEILKLDHVQYVEPDQVLIPLH